MPLKVNFFDLCINSQNQLYNQIVKYSLYNCTTIICENVRYFINRYDISRDDWNSLINILYNNIDLYITQHTLIDDICVATSIRELCESRDSKYTNIFDRNESRKLIDFLCTTNPYSLLCMYLLRLYLSVMCYLVIFLPNAFIYFCFNMSMACCTS